VGIVDILRIREIRVVILGTFVIMLGYGILSPALPLYARSFGVGYDAVGLLVSAFAFTRLVFDLLTGSIVDRFGERATITTGCLIVAVSSALAAVAPTFPLLVLFRGAGGAGSAVFFAGIMSYLLRTSPQELLGRVMGVFFGAFNLGIILGQPIGGATAHLLGLASPLWVYSGACFLAAGLYVRSLDRTPRRSGGGPRPGLRALPWNRPLVATLVANGAYFWMVASVFTTLSPLFGRERVGLSELGLGLVLAIASATEFAVLFPVGSATDKLGRRAVLLPSFLGLAAVVAAMGLTTSIAAFAVAQGVLGIVAGAGGVPIPVLLSDVVPTDLKPTAIGMYRFVGDLGFVLGPLVAGGAASAFGFPAAFALSAVPCLVALGFLASIPETLPGTERGRERAGR
jgi:MFS transporter, ACDE family, multidrug resistance protein